jgi:HEAT repeat protein
VLVKTMNNDPNSNVRLAALEALSKYHREPYVKKQLIESMTLQKDPVVQIALIEFLSKLRNTNIKNALQKIAEDNNTDKPVKDQAYSTLTKISL